MNSEKCNDSGSKFKQRWQDVFDRAGRHTADYIFEGEDEVITGLNGDDTTSREALIGGIATAVADFDPVRVLRGVIKVLTENGELDEQDLAAALGKTLTAWTEKWTMPYPANSPKAVKLTSRQGWNSRKRWSERREWRVCYEQLQFKRYDGEKRCFEAMIEHCMLIELRHLATGVIAGTDGRVSNNARRSRSKEGV